MNHQTAIKCVVCQENDTDRPLVCDPDRRRLDHQLADVMRLHALLPAVLQRGSQPGEKVSGGGDSGGEPVNLDALDLAAAARVRNLTSISDPRDVDGHLSVAAVLDGWVREWREERRAGERLPVPVVGELVAWLRTRLEWACDRHEGVDTFAAALDRLVGQLRSITGQTPARVQRYAAPCRTCDRRALHRKPGGKWIECGACGACGTLLSDDEYDEWSRLVTEPAHLGWVQGLAEMERAA